ncbi:hypothetical protein B566_EDAN008576 [Ephemera danica]|nr:hypothetical protein B566_EDAN008576 [Ephemera danica]
MTLVTTTFSRTRDPLQQDCAPSRSFYVGSSSKKCNRVQRACHQQHNIVPRSPTEFTECARAGLGSREAAQGGVPTVEQQRGQTSSLCPSVCGVASTREEPAGNLDKLAVIITW